MKHYEVDLFKPFCLAYKKEFGTSPQNVFRRLAQGSFTQNKNFIDFYSQTLREVLSCWCQELVCYCWHNTHWLMAVIKALTINFCGKNPISNAECCEPHLPGKVFKDYLGTLFTWHGRSEPELDKSFVEI
jgi:hypothetical protein